MNSQELVTLTVVGCLTLAAVGGFGGAISCQLAKRNDCPKEWAAGATGALMAATTGGTLLAQLQKKRGEGEDDPG
jgi:hypothetical protein